MLSNGPARQSNLFFLDHLQEKRIQVEKKTDRSPLIHNIIYDDDSIYFDFACYSNKAKNERDRMEANGLLGSYPTPQYYIKLLIPHSGVDVGERGVKAWGLKQNH